MTFFVLRALHLIGVVCWFAGLFYLVRLFIYHVEATEELDPKRRILTAQFALMERRLWYAITVPAMFLTAIPGVWLMFGYHDIVHEPWLHVKLAMLALLFGYHYDCGRIRKRLAAGEKAYTSRQLRIYNEVATFLLVGIVFVAVSRNVSMAFKAIGGCALVMGLLVLFLRKKLQGRK
ncbi:MAG: CopD family protein [Nibricoccus sp.]